MTMILQDYNSQCQVSAMNTGSSLDRFSYLHLSVSDYSENYRHSSCISKLHNYSNSYSLCAGYSANSYSQYKEITGDESEN